MRRRLISLLTILSAISIPLLMHAQNSRGGRSSSVNVDGDRAVTTCGDIRVTYNRQPAITDESEFTLPASQVSTLRAQLTNNGMYLTGWDRSEYSVKTCKAVPSGDPDAQANLRAITTSASGGQIAVSGPATGEWTANLIIMVPRLSALVLGTTNGPMSLRDLAGSIQVNAANGPISLNNVGGSVQVTTANGPISETGGSGDHRLSASNGPIHVGLSGSRWDGPGLEASTHNGPLSVSVPNAYGSGISIQTSDRSPVNCSAPACAGATRTPGSPNNIRLGNGDPIVRLSTSNGPLSIQAAK